MIDLNKERKVVHNAVNTLFDIAKVQKAEIDLLNVNIANKQAEIDELKAKLEAAQVPEGFVLVEKKSIENWYLDEYEGMWWDIDGIGNTLGDLDVGDVLEVEHKEYLITKERSLFATKPWDEKDQDVGYWEFFDSKEEAEKAAAYCEAKVEAQGECHG